MEIEIIVLETEDKEFKQFLHNRIKAFNNEKSSYHREARKPQAIRSLSLSLKDQAGTTVGGLAARMYWDWLEIENLYVPAGARGQGTGSRLLKQAESIAQAQGYVHVKLTTFEFQARRFYEKRGYRVVGTLEGFPPGSVYYWMRKDL